MSQSAKMMLAAVAAIAGSGPSEPSSVRRYDTRTDDQVRRRQYAERAARAPRMLAKAEAKRARKAAARIKRSPVSAPATEEARDA